MCSMTLRRVEGLCCVFYDTEQGGGLVLCVLWHGGGWKSEVCVLRHGGRWRGDVVCSMI